MAIGHNLDTTFECEYDSEKDIIIQSTRLNVSAARVSKNPGVAANPAKGKALLKNQPKKSKSANPYGLIPASDSDNEEQQVCRYLHRYRRERQVRIEGRLIFRKCQGGQGTSRSTLKDSAENYSRRFHLNFFVTSKI